MKILFKHILLFSAVFSLLTGCQTVPDTFVYEEINPVVSYQCDNDVAIQCYGSACTADVSDDYDRIFTNFAEDGSLRVCSRSGCWQGHADVSNSKGFLVLTAESIKFTAKNSSQSKTENIAIVLDKNDAVAVLKAGIYSQPLFCN